MKKVNCLGQRFGRLLVIEESPTIKGRAMWKCKCDCGNIKVVSRVCLVDGTKSCGCLLKDTLYKSRITHGRTRTVEYYAWVNMRTRCYNPQCADGIKNYLRKGIIVCERWLNSFENFYEDMGNVHLINILLTGLTMMAYTSRQIVDGLPYLSKLKTKGVIDGLSMKTKG